jgi:hypothetical protein
MNVESRLREKGWKGTRFLPDRDPNLLSASAIVEAPGESLRRSRAIAEHESKLADLRRRLKDARKGGARHAAESLLQDARCVRASCPVRGASALALLVSEDAILWRGKASVSALSAMAEGLTSKGLRLLWKPVRGYWGQSKAEASTVAETDVSPAAADRNIGLAFAELVSRDSSAISFALQRCSELQEEAMAVSNRLARKGLTFPETEALKARFKALQEQASLLKAFAETGAVPHNRSRAYRALRDAVLGGDSRQS